MTDLNGDLIVRRRLPRSGVRGAFGQGRNYSSDRSTCLYRVFYQRRGRITCHFTLGPRRPSQIDRPCLVEAEPQDLSWSNHLIPGDFRVARVRLAGPMSATNYYSEKGIVLLARKSACYTDDQAKSCNICAKYGPAGITMVMC